MGAVNERQQRAKPRALWWWLVSHVHLFDSQPLLLVSGRLLLLLLLRWPDVLVSCLFSVLVPVVRQALSFSLLLLSSLALPVVERVFSVPLQCYFSHLRFLPPRQRYSHAFSYRLRLLSFSLLRFVWLSFRLSMDKKKCTRMNSRPDQQWGHASKPKET